MKFYIIRILTFCSIKTWIQFFFNQSIHILWLKNVLYLLAIMLKYTLFPLNHPFFRYTCFLEKCRHAFVEGNLWSKNRKKYTLFFPVPFQSSKLIYFIENWFWVKEIVNFHLQKIYFVFLKQQKGII